MILLILLFDRFGFLSRASMLDRRSANCGPVCTLESSRCAVRLLSCEHHLWSGVTVFGGGVFSAVTGYLPFTLFGEDFPLRSVVYDDSEDLDFCVGSTTALLHCELSVPLSFDDSFDGEVDEEFVHHATSTLTLHSHNTTALVPFPFGGIARAALRYHAGAVPDCVDTMAMSTERQLRPTHHDTHTPPSTTTLRKMTILRFRTNAEGRRKVGCRFTSHCSINAEGRRSWGCLFTILRKSTNAEGRRRRATILRKFTNAEGRRKSDSVLFGEKVFFLGLMSADAKFGVHKMLCGC